MFKKYYLRSKNNYFNYGGYNIIMFYVGFREINVGNYKYLLQIDTHTHT